MKKIIFLLLLFLCTTRFTKAELNKDIPGPITLCKINGVPRVCNTQDYQSPRELSEEYLAIYLAINHQTGIDEFTLLTSRWEKLPNKIAFSTSGMGCPFGLIKYCDDIRWIKKDKFGRWQVLKRR